MNQPKPFYPPPIVESADTTYYNETGEFTKQDALKNAVVFTGEQVQDAWSNSKLSHLQLISTNKKYRGLPRKIWDAILGLHLSIHEYIPDLWDCDAFSCAFMGLVAWNFEVNGVARVLDNSAGHSYNAILVASDDSQSCQWLVVEPQGDFVVGDPPKGVTVTAPDGAYKAQSGIAITV